MKRIKMPMHRYGDADFDRDYLHWGFHDHETQIQEAESVLRFADTARPLKILDLACGTGAHAIWWAAQGHHVTAVDLSETFIGEARKRASEREAQVDFQVRDIKSMDCDGTFDLVTWIEQPFFSQEIVSAVYRCLNPHGLFIFDARNPNHPRTRAREGNWRTWKEQDGVFCLERHETNAETGEREDVWISIDPERALVTERFGRSRPLSLDDKVGMIRQAGFSHVELCTMEGTVLPDDQGPYWLWVVGRK